MPAIVVVEAHQHVLEHIHFVLRRRLKNKKGLKQWSMIHFDSHPDLACPNEDIPAMACFLPRKEWVVKKRTSNYENFDDEIIPEKKNLYDLLDTSLGGIAEWILPLVLAGGLNQVVWIKNEWCSQFNNGHYDFQVGAWMNGTDHPSPQEEIESFLDLPSDAVVKSSLMHPYYIDDNSNVPENELLLKEKMNLSVMQIDGRNASFESISDINSMGQGKELKDWVLDVCLDYFFCSNPFLDELQRINVDIAFLFQKAVNQTKFKLRVNGCQENLTEDQCIEYKRCQEEFNSLVRRLLNSLNTAAYDKENNMLNDQEYHELYSYYRSDEGLIIWDDLVKTIWNDKSYPRDKLMKIMLNALPNLSLPHVDQHAIDPFHVGGELSPFIKMKVKQFGDHLRRKRQLNGTVGCKQFHDEPMLISMARSSDDGYTPSAIVENLQLAVLTEIHSLYCGCTRTTFDGSQKLKLEDERCKLNIVFDYGEYEGSSLERCMCET